MTENEDIFLEGILKSNKLGIKQQVEQRNLNLKIPTNLPKPLTIETSEEYSPAVVQNMLPLL